MIMLKNREVTIVRELPHTEVKQVMVRHVNGDTEIVNESELVLDQEEMDKKMKLLQKQHEDQKKAEVERVRQEKEVEKDKERKAQEAQKKADLDAKKRTEFIAKNKPVVNL